MRRITKLFTLFLAFVLLFNLAIPVLAVESTDNFVKVNLYLNGQFTDVKTSDWFNNDVARVYELGLMKGTSNTAFSPYDDVTIAEAIVLACRLFSIYYADGEEFTQGEPWYQVYVDYALKNKIINYGYIDYTKSATRAEVVQILSQALSGEELKAINNVEDGAIPDVSKDSSYVSSVYLFYRAGILSGNDSVGSFCPKTCIKRGEVAAIVSRMADSSLRKHFELKVITADTITLNKDTVILEIGKQIQLEASILPLNTADKTISWTSSMPNVASVSDHGVITAHGAGITQITATTANGKFGTCSVSVPMKRADANGTRIIAINPENDSKGVFLKWNYIEVAFNKNVKSIRSNEDINLINLSTGKRISVTSEIGVTSKISFLTIPTDTLPVDTTFSLYIPKNTIQMQDGTLYGEDIFVVFKTAKTVVKGYVNSSDTLDNMTVVLKNSKGDIYPATVYSENRFYAVDLPKGEYYVFVCSKDCGSIVVQEGQINNVVIQYN